MPSPFSNKNLPFLIFVVVAIALVFVLVFKPFQSGFGDAPIQDYMSAPSGILSDLDKAIFIQNNNQFGSSSVTTASGDLDMVIKYAKKELAMPYNTDKSELVNLYSQATSILDSAISYRNSINSNTSVDQILTWTGSLRSIVGSFVAKKRSINAKKF